MTQQSFLPILIFAQSARFIAQSATQAGFTVWVADCFCDTDTTAVAQRYCKLPPLSEISPQQLLKTLSALVADQPCQLVCGTGIEQFYPILSQLPANIQLLGNTPTTIQQVKTPQLFFSLLAQLALPFPETRFEFPHDNDANWLFKPTAGNGGMDICFTNGEAINKPGYYQQYIDGVPASVLFISDGQQNQLLSVNRQYCSNASSQPFWLQKIETPFNLSEQIYDQLTSMVRKLVKATKLKGINSIDFIIERDRQQILLLEVNPRLSASAELLQLSQPIFVYHYAVCQGQALPNLPVSISSTSTRLVYVFADETYSVPDNMSWPEQCHDIPHVGTTIQIGMPICSLLLADGPTIELDLQQQRLSQKIIENLSPLS